ncbi:MAG: toll/interleukin-1 receptor domain-containing protein [Prosthecochloris sp.]|uniref:TIR protein n=1 Tax=Prosthecochloris aestuarii (strain DSM 271 / SK 413) TaxID=290512 RepID=B4S588_PROA2|nr:MULTISPECIES: toll/interleukin-1 receptor domain-containing protein [Prosthecochloris]ACF47034.1 TIR protein [Prosthecochloris aestuarii DSM 271]MCW8799252.1 toll/interleukin-1 receptor domain-containing protein [Prosthecochloris sp.]NEX11130.1 toll/interleukin-1 receptor domain-containing protein [Prosthecochloris sp.]
MKMFWSYARLDDMEPKRKVSKLRKAFENVLSQTQGTPCDVFFDRDSLHWGVAWREEIERSIRECDGIVAVVSPSYFNRRMCLYELQMAVEARKKIFPLYYRSCSELRSAFKEDGDEAEINRGLNSASLIITELQMMDFRELRNEKIGSKKVEDFLDRMAEVVS